MEEGWEGGGGIRSARTGLDAHVAHLEVREQLLHEEHPSRREEDLPRAPL